MGLIVDEDAIATEKLWDSWAKASWTISVVLLQKFACFRRFYYHVHVVHSQER